MLDAAGVGIGGAAEGAVSYRLFRAASFELIDFALF